MDQPAPFVIKNLDDASVIASDGKTAVIGLDGATMFLRRGIRVVRSAPVAEKILPQINQLAGELLAHSAMPAEEVKARLHILMSACDTPQPQHLETCVVELDGVRAYVNDGRVILTRQDLTV